MANNRKGNGTMTIEHKTEDDYNIIDKQALIIAQGITTLRWRLLTEVHELELDGDTATKIAIAAYKQAVASKAHK